MTVLVVSLLLIGVLLVGLLVALVDPALPRRLVGRHLGAWQGPSRRRPWQRAGRTIIHDPLRRGIAAVPPKLRRAVDVEGERAAKPAGLRRNGRLYELVAVADDRSSLYQSEQRR